ncbi:MAG: 50S ribosomal protein L20 [Patescibacteria group bacterium]
MPRVKRGVHHVKRRRNILQKTKGYRSYNRVKIKNAQTAIHKAGKHAFSGRKLKKRSYRALWQIRINAACREQGATYSRFMNGLKVKGIILDRKVLAELAVSHPKVFTALVAAAQK